MLQGAFKAWQLCDLARERVEQANSTPVVCQDKAGPLRLREQVRDGTTCRDKQTYTGTYMQIGASTMQLVVALTSKHAWAILHQPASLANILGFQAL